MAPMGRQYIIKNKTRYRTDDLRWFVTRAGQMALDDHEKSRVVVTITYRRPLRAAGSSGCATIGGTSCVVRVPKKGMDAFDRIDFARVLVHEFGHVRGLGHDTMRGAGLYRRGIEGSDELYRWAGAREVRVRPPKTKLVLRGPERTEKKLRSLAARQERWETKLRRAQNALKKLHRQRRYHEKRLAAARPGANLA
jgi:hypothetical protein